jgi:hypothetical protein
VHLHLRTNIHLLQPCNPSRINHRIKPTNATTKLSSKFLIPIRVNNNTFSKTQGHPKNMPSLVNIRKRTHSYKADTSLAALFEAVTEEAVESGKGLVRTIVTAVK